MKTIATWNVQNLFRSGTPGGPATEAAYQEKLSALVTTIDAIAPDVLALQEIGSPEALADLVAKLAPPPGGGPWEQALSRYPDDRGIRVAVLSGLPVRDSVDVVDLPSRLDPVQVSDTEVATRMGRGALLVSLARGTTLLHVVTCHLKSKLLSYPDGRFVLRDEDERARYGAYALYRRAAEAATVRTTANQVLGGDGQHEQLVVAGDLNDTEQAATTQLLLGPGGSEIGTAGYDVPDGGDAWRLWDLAPLIPEARRYSRIYRGRPELIDHILVSHALLGSIDSVDTVLDPEPPSIADDPGVRPGGAGSDHAPVVLRLRDP